MEDIIQKLNEPLTQLVVLGVTLAFYALCYSVRLAGGKRRTKKQKIKWSWERFWDDLHFRLSMGYSLIASVIAVDMAQWLLPLLGMTISGETAAILNANIIITLPFVAGLNELIAGIKLLYKVWRYQENSSALGVSTDPSSANLQKIAHDVYDFIDTITPKPAKEQLEEEGAPSEVLEGEVLNEVEVGMGGFANTYVEPYRSRPQDSMVDPSTCYNRECVSYTAWKIFELTGKWPTRTGGMNARYWVQRLAENGYTKVVDRPRNGGKYVGVTDAGTYGHVVWFEVDNVISEYNYLTRGGFSTRTINLDAYKWVEIQAPAKEAVEAVSEPATTKKKTVTYTYRAGDTFGEVIRKLGLATKHGLWGADGDVIYYTKQLGITGNIPIGTKLKFTPRKD